MYTSCDEFLLGFFLWTGIYGAMAVVGRFICSVTGIDSMGGFQVSLDAIVQGLGYAAPPIMALLFILDVSWLIDWLIDFEILRNDTDYEWFFIIW